MSAAIRVAIVDDEPLARLAVRTRLSCRPEFALVAEYGDGDSAYDGILELQPDLVIIDVEMPGRRGVDLLAALPPERRPMAILLTAHDCFAIQAFALAALDYLLKPVDEDRFDEALERARAAHAHRQHAAPPVKPFTRSFSVRAGARTVLVPADAVERIEADGDYATLHTGGKTWLLRERLHGIAGQLDPRQFARVHRSTIVRLDMITELRALTNRDAMLRLRDGSLLRASRTYMPALVQALDQFKRKSA